MNIELMDKLNWNVSEEEKERAISALLNFNDVDYSNLIPGKGKAFWEATVELIKRKSYPDNTKGIPGLFYLLKDMNWPGSISSFEYLKSLDSKVIISFLEKSLKEAYEDEDSVWISGLKPIVEYFGFTSKDFGQIDLQNVLSKSEW